MGVRDRVAVNRISEQVLASLCSRLAVAGTTYAPLEHSYYVARMVDCYVLVAPIHSHLE